MLKELLARHDYKVSSALGQNFLCDAGAVAAILAAAEPAGRDVLEIGPGCGTLTAALAATSRRVLAIEVARRLEPVLRETLRGRSNVEVIFEDFLHVAAERFTAPEPWLMVSNLPYAITTPALFRFLDGEIRWSRMIITIQAEVAARMAAKPGTGEYGGLSIAAQAAATVSVVKRLSSSAFWPQPRVSSAVVRLEPRRGSRPATLRSLLRDAFSARRKTLRNALAAHPVALETLCQRGIEIGRRPETVAVDDWVAAAAAEAGAACQDATERRPEGVS